MGVWLWWKPWYGELENSATSLQKILHRTSQARPDLVRERQRRFADACWHSRRAGFFISLGMVPAHIGRICGEAGEHFSLIVITTALTCSVVPGRREIDTALSHFKASYFMDGDCFFSADRCQCLGGQRRMLLWGMKVNFKKLENVFQSRSVQDANHPYFSPYLSADDCRELPSSSSSSGIMSARTSSSCMR